MGGKHGVENLSKIVVAMFEVGEVGQDLAKNDYSTFGKIGRLATLLDDALSVMSVDVAMLKKEASELDSDDKAQLIKNVKEEFDLEDDKLEQKVMLTLAHGLDIVQSVQEIRKVVAA